MGGGSPGASSSSLSRRTDAPDEGAAGLSGAGRNFLEGAGITFGGLVIAALLSIMNEVLVARFLGVEIYAVYAIGLMLAKIGEILAMFGLSFGLLHYLPTHLRRGESALALGAVIGALFMPLILGSTFAVGLALEGDWIAAHVFHKPEAARFITALGFAIPLFAVADVLGNTARGFGRALPYIAIRGLIPGLLYATALGVIMVLNLSPIATAYGLLASTGVGALAGLCWVGRLLRRRIGSAVAPVFRLRALYGYSLPVLLHLVISLSLAYTDMFLLGILANVEAVGIYRACIQVIFAFDLVLSACSAASAPLYPVQIAGQQTAELAATYGAGVRLAAVIATPGLLLILSNSVDILAVLGPGFVAGALPLAILACGYFCKTVVGVAGVLLIIGGQPRLELRNGLVTAGLNLLLNLLLIPRFGLIGAALSTATAFIVLSLLRMRQVRRAFGLYTIDRMVRRVVLFCTPVAIAALMLSIFAGIGPGTGLVTLALRLAISGALLAATLWTFCLHREDRDQLIGLLLRRGEPRPITGS